MLGVPQSYTWHKLETRVLAVAQQELKEKTNIYMSVERRKTSRKITHLHIRFIEDAQQTLDLDQPSKVA